LTDILNKEAEKPVGSVFKTRFGETKDNLEQKIKKIKESGFGFKKET
jgi:hypothetical protein